MRNTYRKLAMPALAAAAAALSGAGVAKADLTFSIVTTAYTTDTVYVVRAFNNNTNGTGTQLGGIEANAVITSGAGSMVINFTDIDGDSVADANILGAAPYAGGSALTIGSSVGTFLTFGSGFVPAAVTANGGLNALPAIKDWTSGATGGTPTQTVNPAYSNLTQLRIAGTNAAFKAPSAGFAFFNLVVPKADAGFILPLSSDGTGKYISADTTLYFGSTPVASGPIVSLTSTAPTNMGSQLAGLTVKGANGKYISSISNVGNIKGISTPSGYSNVSGFSSTPSNDTEVFLLKLSTSADDSQIISDINATPGTSSINLVASAVAAGLQGMDGITWDIELVDSAPGAEANGVLAFNLTDVSGVNVTAVDAVPEPATLGLLALSGIGLLARRRRA